MRNGLINKEVQPLRKLFLLQTVIVDIMAVRLKKNRKKNMYNFFIMNDLLDAYHTCRFEKQNQHIILFPTLIIHNDLLQKITPILIKVLYVR
jgi:hypothetical protein